MPGGQVCRYQLLAVQIVLHGGLRTCPGIRLSNEVGDGLRVGWRRAPEDLSDILRPGRLQAEHQVALLGRPDRVPAVIACSPCFVG